MPWSWFIWQDNPYSLEGVTTYNSTVNNGAVESHGLAFTAPYWIGLWAGSIQQSGFVSREGF
jgi:hypothetical protein